MAGSVGRVLLTGASGYVGGRLLSRLRSAGHSVRCLARRPGVLVHLEGPSVEAVQGDVQDFESLKAAFDGVEQAFYLIHSMGMGADFEERDRAGAENFARAASEAGVRRIVYLGGLVGEDGALSSHLRSRVEVGDALRSTGVEVVEFRASVILGSGSLSYELVRALVERLPVMVTPRWVDVPAQPIGIEDVLSYLAAALDMPSGPNRTFEIGGPDVVTYGGLMRAYARLRGLRRMIVPIPLLTPRLSSLWLGLVTPVYARVGRKLIDSMRHPSVIRDLSALDAFPVRPAGCTAALEAALRNEDREFAETRWSDAVSSSALRPSKYGQRFGNRLVDTRSMRSSVPGQALFRVVERIGGKRGWYFANGLWRIRGAIDLLMGGVGMRRGRRDPERLVVGDVVDWWRVESIDPGRMVRLAAEMRLPGRGWLQFEVSEDQGSSDLRLTVEFDPLGLFGLLYWYSVYPFHALVFRGMLRSMVGVAEREQAAAANEKALRRGH